MCAAESNMAGPKIGLMKMSHAWFCAANVSSFLPLPKKESSTHPVFYQFTPRAQDPICRFTFEDVLTDLWFQPSYKNYWGSTHVWARKTTCQTTSSALVLHHFFCFVTHTRLKGCWHPTPALRLRHLDHLALKFSAK